MRVAMVSGNMPDIFYYWFGESFTRMIDSQIVTDLTDMLTKSPEFKNQFYPEALQYASHNNRIYGIPHSVQHLHPPETWEELMNLVQTLKENQICCRQRPLAPASLVFIFSP
jgi:raffinose/stachyose/melibiose transport system substrate-binding protein